MTALAPTLEAFFIDRLARQRGASPHTVAAYRDTFRLLVGYAQDRSGMAPSRLDFADLDAPFIAAFLDHLETERGNSVRTRNARLAAIHSLFRYAALRHPEHASLIARVLAIPAKRHDNALVSYLTGPEVAALLDAPDRATWLGRRDHALLLVAVQCGLRVSELTGLTVGDARLGTGAHVRCHGKGRKERATPLSADTRRVLQAWMAERGGHPTEPLFPTRQGGALSTDAIEKLVTKHVKAAAKSCLSLRRKRVTPHTLRHSSAMALLSAGLDASVIALWLGHEQVQTTSIYFHADLTMKEKALAMTTPPRSTPGRYTPPDALLAFLE
ncbi:MAG: site-specific integrase, partial [Actinobacteria bacterium]|nr:site-specific integrase [Actinomycetota bacterium]